MSKWKNYGDVNPRVHGGCFIRDKGDCLDIINIDWCKDAKGYYIQSSEVLVDDLFNNKGLFEFSDAKNAGSREAQLIWLATAYHWYRQADENETTSNFYKGLRRYGIYSWE